jgi:hypothetical protein
MGNDPCLKKSILVAAVSGSRGHDEIQWQVYVGPNDSARGTVRHPCESYAIDLSEFIPTNNQMAVHRDSLGLKGFV